MILKHVHLENCRQFKALDLDFTVGVNVITGGNEEGKTTVLDAIMFCLTGKLLSGSQDPMSLKPNHDTALKVAVELTFETGWANDTADRPATLILRREYFEHWATSRGSTVQYLAGHDTQCYINTQKKTVQDYEKEILQYFGLPNLEWVQILMDAKYAALMDVKPLREIVVKITGEPKPEDLLKQIKGGHLIEKIFRDNYFNIDLTLKRIRDDVADKKFHQNECDTMAKGIKITDPVSEKEYTDAVQLIATNMNLETTLKAKRAGVKNPNVEALKKALDDHRKTLNACIAQDNAALSKANSKIQEDVSAMQTQLNGLYTSKRQAVEDHSKIEKSITAINDETFKDRMLIQRKKAEKQVKLNQWYEIDAREFKASQSEVCPSCGFDLTADANAKARAEFNVKKADDLTQNEKDGLQLKAEIDKLEKDIETRTATLPKLEEDLKVAKALMVNYENQIRDLDLQISKKKQEISYVAIKSPETVKAEEEIQSTEAAIKVAENESVDTAEIDKQIADLVEPTKKAQAIKTQYLTNKTLMQTKLDHERNRDVYGEQLATAQQMEDAMLSYQKAWLEDISKRSETYFPHINLRMVKKNVKADSWENDCTVMNDAGIPFPTMSNAEKNVVGIRFIEDLRNAKNFLALPILNDDAEHFDYGHFKTAFHQINQVIAAVVDPNRSRPLFNETAKVDKFQLEEPNLFTTQEAGA